MLSQIDDEGHRFQLLRNITDHKPYGNAIAISDGFINSRNGNNGPKNNTDGWKLQVEWKDIATSWVPLKDIKASNPIELSEYTINNNIEHKPFFHWLVRKL